MNSETEKEKLIRINKEWDKVTKKHDPILDKDGKPIGKMIVFGTTEGIVNNDWKNAFKKPSNFNLIEYPQNDR